MDPHINLNVEPSAQQEPLETGEAMEEVIRRIYRENKKMTQMVVDIFEKYSYLHSQLLRHFKIGNIPREDEINTNLDPQIRKRNADHLDILQEEDDDNNMISSCIIDGNYFKRIKMINFKPKVSRALVHVDSSDSSLRVKDGYQWRKYGQKVTRDNPSPRAYFKCSFAPLCPVKKKVQRSVEDPKVLEVTYEGEHTHKKLSSNSPILSTKIPSPPSSMINLTPSSTSHISSPDHFIHQSHTDNNHKDKGSENNNLNDQERGDVQHWLVQQMASSLTKDPSFKSTLATAISDKVLEHTFC